MPKYADIVEIFTEEIKEGKYSSSSRFPSVMQIRRRFGISHLTAVKVLDGLKSLGLIQSRQGTGTFLRAVQTRRIGLLMPALSEAEIFSPICSVVSHICEERGHPLLFADIPMKYGDETVHRVCEAARSFIRERVSGVLFHPVDCCDFADEINGSVIEEFSKAGIPVVLLDCEPVSGPVPWTCDLVGIDNVTVGRELGAHVITNGSRRILFVLHNQCSSNVRSRLLGLRDSVSVNPGTSVVGEYSIHPAPRKTFSSCMNRLKPDAIVCTSDHVAAQVLRMLSAMGKRVPEDVLLTGVNDQKLATLTSPALTTIHQPCEDIARTALDTLEWRISCPTALPRRILLPAPLVVRESTTRKRKDNS